jgi:hypothetical protein
MFFLRFALARHLIQDNPSISILFRLVGFFSLIIYAFADVALNIVKSIDDLYFRCSTARYERLKNTRGRGQ